MLIKAQADYDSRYPTVPLERWKNNVIVAASMIRDEKYQAETWFREDRNGWENPNELICDFLDGVLFELFLEDCAFVLSAEQLRAGRYLLSQLIHFCTAVPDTLISVEVFHDVRWGEVRVAARKFAALLQN